MALRTRAHALPSPGALPAARPRTRAAAPSTAMRLLSVFRFEVAYQLRRVPTWIYAAVLLALVVQLTSETYVETARRGAQLLHAPLGIAAVTVLGSAMALLPAAALAGDAAARDVQTRMHPLVYSAPIGRLAYLGGRVLAAFVVQALVLLALPIGFLIAARLSGLDAALLGPLRPAAYVGAYLGVALPNAFVAVALMFAASALTRRPMASYLVGVLLFFASMFCWLLLGVRLGHWELATMLDPMALTVLSRLSRAWSPAERNVRLVALDPSMLTSRALWTGLAFGVLAIAGLRFRFAHPTTAGGWWPRRAPRADAASDAAREASHRVAIRAPSVRRTFGAATRLRQLRAVVGESFRLIVTSGGGVVLVVLSLLLVASGPGWTQHLGIPMRPTTGLVTSFLGDFGEPIWAMLPFLIAFYAGELVWRERDAGLGEIADAAPMPEWVPLLGRFLGLALVLLATQALVMLASMLIQARQGYHDFELGLYARIVFGLQLLDYLSFAVLAFAVHVVVNHKYVGHAVVLLGYGLMAFGAALGVREHLAVFGATPGWSYSDMRGFAPHLAPVLWFELYWGAWAILLAIAARLLWVRGREDDRRSRLRVARGRVTRPLVAASAIAAALVVASGGWIFHNTHVLNAHDGAAASVARSAEYERRYRRFARAPQPAVVGTSLRVELHPARGAVEIRGAHRLVNASGVPIDSVHVSTPSGVGVDSLALDRPARAVLADGAVGHHILALARPLLPGDTVTLRFAVRFARRGFPSAGIDASVTPNGTFFVGQGRVPAVGYQPDRELDDPADRRRVGLGPRAAVRSLHDTAARHEVGDQRVVAFEAIVGTDAGQLALAPGRLRRSWSEGGRRYFHYVADAPIRNDYAIFSAAYAVHERRWRDPATGTATGGASDVAIQIVHHPAHPWNVDRLARSVAASLDYLTREFGPYPHGQLRLVEHPGSAVSLHAFPVNVSYQERFALLDPDADARGVDFPFAVAAHEIAHQWWGNQLTPASIEGGPLLTESLAWYSAIGAVERAYGAAHRDALLAMMRDAYLAPRARAGVPLLRSTSSFDAYRKGPFAVYALREYVGEARVNGALRRLLARHPAGVAPLATSLDLLRELRAATPDSLHPLLADLFERNTYWELATDGVVAAPAGAGTWRVTLDVRARKLVADSAGVETERPMDDVIEIGVYGAATAGGARAGAPRPPLYLRAHRVRAGRQRITITVPGRPARAGIDPRHLLTDDAPGDNVREIATRVGG
jgi:ABC-type transport system involved in multi-copper enzyme maturation permease subunit